MLRKYELSFDALHRVCGEARALGLVPLATPFSLDDVDTIEKLGLPAIKIASPDLVNRPLLDRAARTGRAMIVSTGAATLHEVSTAMNWLRDLHAPAALLHCVSSYPTPVHEANLSWIDQLTRKFNVPVGFSDHTTEPLAGALAVAAGASIVEKHLTYDRTAAGPDHSASADPAMFRQYVDSVRLAQAMRGAGTKRVLDVERDVRQLSRQSLVLRRDLEPGEQISESDLTVQRPGTGIAAAMIRVTIGRRVAKRLAKGTMLQWNMLSDAA